ncbi:MAG: cytochrome c class I [Bacteroidetes bacterium]|nr:MAG: cytochrome c class I [Bacteroidota bacterium]
MKQLLFLFILVALAACGGSESKSKTEAPKTADVTKNPDYQKGLELISKSDCFTCHQIDEKLTGPPYREVANKYAGMPDTIGGQIIMTPHPALSQADAETMVRYILLLKK